MQRWAILSALLNSHSHFAFKKLRAAEKLKIKRQEQYLYKLKCKMRQLAFYYLTDIHVIMVYMRIFECNLQSFISLLVNRCK